MFVLGPLVYHFIVSRVSPLVSPFRFASRAEMRMGRDRAESVAQGSVRARHVMMETYTQDNQHTRKSSRFPRRSDSKSTVCLTIYDLNVLREAKRARLPLHYPTSDTCDLSSRNAGETGRADEYLEFLPTNAAPVVTWSSSQIPTAAAPACHVEHNPHYYCACGKAMAPVHSVFSGAAGIRIV